MKNKNNVTTQKIQVEPSLDNSVDPMIKISED